jgi:hypothetical protein
LSPLILSILIIVFKRILEEYINSYTDVLSILIIVFLK